MGLHLNFEELIKKAAEPYINKGIVKGDLCKLYDEITEFFKQRLKNVLLDRDYEYDVIDSVLKVGLTDIQDSYLKIEELTQWKKREDFLNIVSSFIRVSNLAKKADNAQINAELLSEAEEKRLYESYINVSHIFNEAMAKKEYDNALKAVMTMKPCIDDFFDNIMVMVEDENIRKNRLAILKSIENMMLAFADLSVIVINK